MIYDPKSNSLVISIDNARQSYYLMLYALKSMRKQAGITLDKYEREGMLTPHDSAAIAIIEMAAKLGIEMGVTPHEHNKLDLRDV